MARILQAERDLQAQQAAYLCAVHGASQKQIGGLLGNISQAVVSRLLQHAVKAGWLERRLVFHEERLPKERLEMLRRLAVPPGLFDALKALGAASGVCIRNLRIVDTGGSTGEKRSVDARLTRFGHVVAPHLASLIQRSEVFAVTWGSTVSHVIAGLETLTSAVDVHHAIRYVPVCGEPTAHSSDRDTSSRLALRLELLTRSTGTSSPTPSLSGVMALIPRKFTGTRMATIRELIEETASYMEVFGGSAPLINKVDSVLTSVGPSSRPMGFIHEELIKAGRTDKGSLTKAALAALVAGDMGGVLLPRPGLDKAGLREVDELNRMWTGINRGHFERIARQADEKKRPGVIVVSCGAERSEIVTEVVRCGLVNELIIDRELANRLARQLGTDRP